jgi:hypothetical protein
MVMRFLPKHLLLSRMVQQFLLPMHSPMSALAVNGRKGRTLPVAALLALALGAAVT